MQYLEKAVSIRMTNTHITECNQTEDNQALAIKILECLNELKNSQDLIPKILELIKNTKSLEAVGIRLREGEDFPYFVTQGFSSSFIQEENSLCTFDKLGRPLRDSDGSIHLECMCGNVICRRTDTSMPFYTEGGSFWTNNMKKLLSSTLVKKERKHLRGKCNSNKYKSVALIPLRAHGEIIGLLQLNDSYSDFFTLETILFFEKIGHSIGIALKRMQMEAMLNKNESFLQSVLDSFEYGISILDKDLNIARINTKKKEWYANKLPFKGRKCFDVYLGMTKKCTICPSEQPPTNPPPTQMTTQIVTADGAKKWFEIHCVPIIDTDGNMTELALQMWDITEQKAREEALRDSEIKFRSVTQSANDAIISADSHGNIISWNKGAEKIFGYNEKEILGNALTVLMPEEFKNNHDSRFKKIRSTSKPTLTKQTIEAQGLRKDGRAFPLEISTACWEKEGETFYSAIIRDITQRKKIENELKSSEERLRNLSLHLQNAREEEKTAIARDIHDEFGQALIVLKMDTHWLKDKLSWNHKPLIEKTVSMLLLIDKTLHAIRRISSELRPAVLDKLGLIEAIKWQAEEFQKRSEISYALFLDESITMEKSRSIIVFRIIQEILTNIARHSNAANARISLKRKNNHIILTAKDNGRGITKKEINSQHTFGLIGMKERILGLGGKITIKGIPEEGTSITVYIPLNDNGETDDKGTHSR